MLRYGTLAALSLSASLIAFQAAQADIKIGITVSASGPGAALGQPEMKAVGALPAEVAGEKITYIALDDESDGTKSAQNMRKLIADEKVDAMIGSSLTPTSLHRSTGIAKPAPTSASPMCRAISSMAGRCSEHSHLRRSKRRSTAN